MHHYVHKYIVLKHNIVPRSSCTHLNREWYILLLTCMMRKKECAGTNLCMSCDMRLYWPVYQIPFNLHVGSKHFVKNTYFGSNI